MCGCLVCGAVEGVCHVALQSKRHENQRHGASQKGAIADGMTAMQAPYTEYPAVSEMTRDMSNPALTGHAKESLGRIRRRGPLQIKRVTQSCV
jgi:hypothetical protein